MSSLSTIRFALLALAFFVQGSVAQYPPGKTFKDGYCNICRDAPNLSVAWRNLANPNQSFDMNGESWTCGYLQDTVQDVNPYAGGAPGEARMCAIAQTFAEENCECTGPAIPGMDENVDQLNPACDLCKGQTFNHVPSVNSGITADTGVAGNMNCGGLYTAMAKGVLTSNLCPLVQDSAGPVCCNLESIEIGVGNRPVPNNPVPVSAPTARPCSSAATVCYTNSDCCAGLECKAKTFGGDKFCSAARTRPRVSLAGAGVGGAAGRSRAGN